MSARCQAMTIFLKKLPQTVYDMLSFVDYYMTNLKETSVDNKWNKLEQAIKDSMKANLPCKTKSNYNLPWFSRFHRRLCKTKQKIVQQG